MPERGERNHIEALNRWLREGLDDYRVMEDVEELYMGLTESGVIPFKTLSDSQWSSLREIPAPSFPTTQSPWRPARVVLESGKILDTVYFMDEITYFCYMGVDLSHTYVPVDQIRSIEPSPLQIPPEFVNKIYEVEETMMGGIIFYLYLGMGRRVRCCYGGLCDFVQLPKRYTPADITDVKITWSRRPNKRCLESPEIAFCVHAADSSTVNALRKEWPMPRLPVDDYIRLRTEVQ